MNHQIRILSTKKLLQSQKQFLLNAGFSVVDADFIEIGHKTPELRNVNDNLIFTSSNAVRSVIEETSDLKSRPCFCVGPKTKELLENNGFKINEFAENAAELGKIISEKYRDESFTFFTGNLTLETLPGILRNANMKLDVIEVYETMLTPVKINTPSDGILFFSPSGIESYLRANEINDETCFCIGSTTAKALENITDKIVIANQPTIENTIIQTINHYKNA